MNMTIPNITIGDGVFHWKVGDGLDVNGGEDIAQIALIFKDKTHFNVRMYNPSGREISCTPGVVDAPLIKAHNGTIPKVSQYKSRTIPISRRTKF